jgi:signal transduction histidine kinase
MVTARGLVLVTDIPMAAGAVVVADPDRLTQLLLVLVDNAMAHSPAGGMVHLAAAREGTGSAAISVTDQGPGIPEGLREAIFEPFARPPGARRTQGSGLGLAIARQLVTRQGGTLEVADPAHRPDGWPTGACLVLRLPLAPGDPIADGRPVPGPVSPG